jgi:hypothetical protein
MLPKLNNEKHVNSIYMDLQGILPPGHALNIDAPHMRSLPSLSIHFPKETCAMQID